MAQWQLVGQIDVLSQKKCQRLYAVTNKKEDLALFYVKGKFYAMEAWCGHMGGPLFNGDIEDYRGSPHIVCPWHGYKFEVSSGENKDIGLFQEIYPTKEEEGELYVKYKSALSLDPPSS